MKNIQVIDGALNCTYSLFAATDDEFARLFPGGTDVGFPDEIDARLGEEASRALLQALWARPVAKPDAVGIHGTIFFGLDGKKSLYPTRKEREMDPRAYSTAQRAAFGIADPG